jgi:2-iminobutanoate/2-iminopropanoate deaminase
MKTIVTKNAPEPIGPYSQAMAATGLVFVSGQVGKNAVSGEMINDTIKNETLQVMNNVKAVLEAAGTHLGKVVKTTIFLKNINDFAQVNEVYGSFFKDNFPARETVEVSRLPLNANVEISVIAEGIEK